MVSLLREGSSKGTVGSLDSLDSLEFYIILTKKLVVPLKNRKKKWGHFLKLDILKMSIFQNAIIKFYKKSEKTIFTRICFKYQKNHLIFVIIKFYYFI
jgi:hypothetical protein